MTQEPITDREQIIIALQNAEVGDELTIESESGYRDNRTVQDTSNRLIQFGDPTGPGRAIDVDRATVHRWTSDPDSSLSHGMEITKLWVW